MRTRLFMVLASMGAAATVGLAAAEGLNPFSPPRSVGAEDVWQLPTGLSGAVELLNDTFERGLKTGEMLSGFGHLSPGDADAEPNFSPPGTPSVPSACMEDDARCGECYAKAVHEINFLRNTLEQLRAVGQSTVKMIDSSVAFGDSLAPQTGLASLSWMNERRGILKSKEQFGKTYDAKYQQLIANLETQLKKFGSCEERAFGNRDWYGRFGFIYHSFMADRYKRNWQ